MPGKPSGYKESVRMWTRSIERKVQDLLEERFALESWDSDLLKHVRTFLGIFKMSRQDLVQAIHEEELDLLDGKKFTDGEPRLDDLRKSVFVFELTQLTCLTRDEALPIVDDIFEAYATLIAEDQKEREAMPMLRNDEKDEPASRSEQEASYASAFPALSPKGSTPDWLSVASESVWQQRTPLRSNLCVQSSGNKIRRENCLADKESFPVRKMRSFGKENECVSAHGESKKRAVKSKEFRCKKHSRHNVVDDLCLAVARAVLLDCLGVDGKDASPHVSTASINERQIEANSKLAERSVQQVHSDHTHSKLNLSKSKECLCPACLQGAKQFCLDSKHDVTEQLWQPFQYNTQKGGANSLQESTFSSPDPHLAQPVHRDVHDTSDRRYCSRQAPNHYAVSSLVPSVYSYKSTYPATELVSEIEASLIQSQSHGSLGVSEVNTSNGSSLASSGHDILSKSISWQKSVSSTPTDDPIVTLSSDMEPCHDCSDQQTFPTHFWKNTATACDSLSVSTDWSRKSTTSDLPVLLNSTQITPNRVPNLGMSVKQKNQQSDTMSYRESMTDQPNQAYGYYFNKVLHDQIGKQKPREQKNTPTLCSDSGDQNQRCHRLQCADSTIGRQKVWNSCLYLTNDYAQQLPQRCSSSPWSVHHYQCQKTQQSASFSPCAEHERLCGGTCVCNSSDLLKRFQQYHLSASAPSHSSQYQSKPCLDFAVSTSTESLDDSAKINSTSGLSIDVIQAFQQDFPQLSVEDHGHQFASYPLPCPSRPPSPDSDLLGQYDLDSFGLRNLASSMVTHTGFSENLEGNSDDIFLSPVSESCTGESDFWTGQPSTLCLEAGIRAAGHYSPVEYLQPFCSCKGACNCPVVYPVRNHVPVVSDVPHSDEPKCLGFNWLSTQTSKLVTKSASDSNLYPIPSERSAFEKVNRVCHAPSIHSQASKNVAATKIGRPCLVKNASKEQMKRLLEGQVMVIVPEELSSDTSPVLDQSILRKTDLFGKWTSEPRLVPGFLLKVSKEIQTTDIGENCCFSICPTSEKTCDHRTYEEKLWKDLRPLTEEDIRRDRLYARAQASFLDFDAENSFFELGTLEDYEQSFDFQFPAMLLPQHQMVYVKDLEKWMTESPKQSCKNKEKSRRPLHPNKPCSFYLEGCCYRSDCKFSHDISTITCHFWEEGQCFKGDLCPFLHGYVSGSENGKKLKEFDVTKEDFPELTRKEPRVNGAPAPRKRRNSKKNSLHRPQLPRGT